MKLGSLSDVARFVEEEEFRGMEFVTAGKRRVAITRYNGGYVDAATGEPYALTIEQATKPCWRPTNDL